MTGTDRKSPPIIQPIRQIELLDAKKQLLDNGIPYYSLSGGDQEVVSVQILLPAGRWQESKPLQSMLVASLLKDGTKEKSSKEVNELIEFYGAKLSVSASYDYTAVRLFALEKYLQPLLNLLIEIFAEPGFHEEELSIKRNNLIDQLKVNEQKTDYLAQRRFHQMLFGINHPYGYASSVEKYKGIHVSDLRAFFTNQYSLNAGFVLVAGKIDDITDAMIKQALEQIHSNKRVAATHSHKMQTNFGVHHERKPDAQQASIRIGQPMVAINHPDFQGLQVLNAVLGGYFGSRLMSNLREEKGYTYGAYSAMSSFLHQGYFLVATDVGVDQAEESVSEIYKEINSLQSEPIPERELQLVKNYMMGKYLARIDGPFAQAKVFKSLILRDERAEDFVERIESIQAMTPDYLQSLAKKHLTPNNMVEVVV